MFGGACVDQDKGEIKIAGMPAIVKPASSTAYLCEAAFRVMTDTGLLPEDEWKANLVDMATGLLTYAP